VSGTSGQVARIESIADTLVVDPDEIYDGASAEGLRQEIMTAIHKHLSSVKFPTAADGGDSQITLPFIFE
jgi:hypothetical protein